MRDIARFGLMLLSNGSRDGQDIIANKQYLKDMLSTSNSFNPSYGYLTWLNGKDSFIWPRGQFAQGPLIPQAPADMYMALGHDDKKIYIVPSLDLVVARYGDAAYDSNLYPLRFDRELWYYLCQANANCVPATGN